MSSNRACPTASDRNAALEPVCERCATWRLIQFRNGWTLTPVVHRFKYVRNRTLERVYRNRGGAARDRFLADNAENLGPKLAVTIAFNTPWVVELLLRAARINLTDMSVVVADNSSDDAAAGEIAALCDQYGAAYARLPRNPEWHPNRSHGVAMNWAYYKPGQAIAPANFRLPRSRHVSFVEVRPRRNGLPAAGIRTIQTQQRTGRLVALGRLRGFRQ